MGNPAADVELVDPGLEPEVEPLVGDRGGPVRVAVAAGEQRHRRPLGGRGGAAVPGDEPGHGGFPACGQPPGQRLGDADRLVVAADLGLVVPEHGQPAVAAGAVQPQAQHLADPPPGDDDRFPDVAQPEVAGVMDLGEPGEAGLIGQGAGHLVGERAALAQRGGPGRGHRGDELPGQPDPLGGTAVQCPPQQLAGVVEGDGPGGRGDDRRGAVLPPHHQGRQSLAFAVPLVGGEPLDVRGGQLRGVVAAAGRFDGQERAQLSGRAAEGVEGAAGARAAWRAQQVSQVVPEQVAQPPLGDAVRSK